MATINLGAAIPDYQWWPFFFQPDDPGRVTLVNATTLRWTNPDGTVVTLSGTGFVFDGTVPIAGTVNGLLVQASGGATLLQATMAGYDLPTFYDYAFGRPGDTDASMGPNGYDFATYLRHGNDTVNGTDHADDIGGGRDLGNDVINALGGDDYIHGAPGSDTIKGGAGWDTLSYDDTFWDSSAYRGIVVNMGTHSLTDSWGATDTFSGIEEIEGSKFADVFNGGAGDDHFHGLRGNDTIKGGAGWDEVLYWKDAQLGGTRGIVVDFGAGTIKDGFGTTDKVSGIESVIGTQFADTFKGGAADEQFLGGGGVDVYNGGAGRDTVNFSWGHSSTGAVVDMSLASGQVLNDGLGNVETLVAIENLDGNDANDRLLGNAAANRLAGDVGDDTLSGRGGNDVLQGDEGQDTLTGGAGADEFYFDKREGHDPWGDQITDFVSGVDHFAIRFGDFAGMDGTVRFQNGTGAGGAGSWFYFNPATHALYWDADGTGGGAAIKVATLTGVNSLTAADILLV